MASLAFPEFATGGSIVAAQLRRGLHMSRWGREARSTINDQRSRERKVFRVAERQANWRPPTRRRWHAQ